MSLIQSFALLWLALLPVRQQVSDPPAPGAEPFAVINGEAVSRAAFSEWLIETHGWRHAEDFTILILFRQEAARLGIELEPDALQRAFESDWQDQVLLRYAGDEQRFLADLGREGIDQDGYRRRRLASLEMRELGRRISAAVRQPDELQLREFYGRLFPAERRVHLQVAFFSRFRDFKEQRTPSESILKELDAGALARAQQFLEDVRDAPERFAELVRERSDLLLVQRNDGYVRDLRDAGGDLPYYDAKYFHGDLEASLQGPIENGELLGPIVGSSGVYVVQVVRAGPVSFEELRDEVREQYLQSEVSASEIYGLRERLLERARIDPPVPGD